MRVDRSPGRGHSICLAIALLSGLCPLTAGAANAEPDTVRAIARLYSVAFDREPKVAGLNFWVDSYEEGSSLPGIATHFYQSPEFTTRYGSLSNEGYVKQLFRNALGRDGNQPGIEFWTGHLDRGTSRAEVLAEFAGSPENISKTAVTFADMRLDGGLWVFSPTVAACPIAGLTPAAGSKPINTPDIPVDFYGDLAYGQHPQMTLDVLVPIADEAVPLIVDIHGGGFTGGDKRNMYALAGERINSILQRNVAYATINYPLLNGATSVIDSLRGGARAVQFLRCHAQELNLDPTRIGATGASAGAGIALWLATHDDLAQTASEDPVQRHSTRLRAVYAGATQATYDIVRWSEVLDTGLQAFIDSGQLASKDISDWGDAGQLLGFYNIDSFQDLYTEEMAVYREDVDMLGLMDSDDAPLCVANASPTTVDLDKLSSWDTLHDALHAMAIKNRADEAGLESVVYAQGAFVHYVEPSGEDCLEFLLRHL